MKKTNFKKLGAVLTAISLTSVLCGTVPAMAEDNNFTDDGYAIASDSENGYSIDTDSNTSEYCYSNTTNTIKSGHIYFIKHSSNYYLEIPLNGILDNGTEAKLSAKTGKMNQMFLVLPFDRSRFVLMNVTSGKVLEVSNGNSDNYARIQQWDFANVTQQEWYFSGGINGYISLINNRTGKAIDVPSNNAYSGQKVQQYQINNTAAESFTFEETSIPTYTYRYNSFSFNRL